MNRALSPRPWIPPEGRPPRILIVRLSALGDVIHALPVLAALRHELPDAVIDWVVEDRFEALVRPRPELNRVLVFPRRKLRNHRIRPQALAGTLEGFLSALRTGPYDAVLDLQGNLKSGIITRAARARVRFGLDRRLTKEGNHLFTTRRALPPRGARHRVERNLGLLSRFLGREIPWRDPGLTAVPEAATSAEARLREAGLEPGGFVLFHPGTSAFGAFKRWPPERYHDLALALLGEGRSVAVSASPSEAYLAAAVQGGDERIVLLPAGNLLELGEILRRASLLVAADTGPLHLAALAGTPVVGLFGPKDPEIYGPYGRRHDGTPGLLDVVVRPDVACRPCRLRQCENPVCMTGLDPDDVLRATQDQ